MLQELGHVALDLLQLGQLQIWIWNSEQISALGVFINENPLSFTQELFFDFEQPFAFQHDREDKASGAVLGIVQLD